MLAAPSDGPVVDASVKTVPRLQFSDEVPRRLTHYVFRYPAKFHPPAVRTLLRGFTREGQCVWDPFCGSGTALVEATAEGRDCVGSDVDPLAVFVTRVKLENYDLGALRGMATRILRGLERLERDPEEYARLQHTDIPETELTDALRGEGLWTPALPNRDHWFRRYVTLDLARMREAIVHAAPHARERRLLLLCFGSIIRNVSNADPVPVSGLEVTSHMRAVDARGRTINPFALYRRAVRSAVAALEEFAALPQRGAVRAVRRIDATRLTSVAGLQCDSVITSPPYHGAVDYYRRHTLEMYWLGLTDSREERLELLQQYLGRPKVPRSHRFLHRGTQNLTPLEKDWYASMAKVSRPRADSFLHYSEGMRRVFRGIAAHLVRGATAVFVVGHSSWNGLELPTSVLFSTLARPYFELVDQFWYPLTNRYMSYSRKNKASIDKEFVLVFERSSEGGV